MNELIKKSERTNGLEKIVGEQWETVWKNEEEKMLERLFCIWRKCKREIEKSITKLIMLKIDGNEEKLTVIVLLTTCSWAVCQWSCLCSKLAGPQDNTAGQSRNRNRPWKIAGWYKSLPKWI